MPKPVLLTEDEFRAAVKGNAVPAEASLRKAFVTEVRAPSDDGRVITFTISTDSVDRMGDTIAVDGWKLDNYRANGVVLWAHDSDELPMAKCRRIWVESNKLMAEADFTPTPTAWPEFNETVFQFLKHGLLNATSVGFAPMKYAFSEEAGRMFGIDFLEQELLEFSIVPVPANPECLQQAKSLGLDVEPMVKWCSAALAKQGLAVLPRARIDAISTLPEDLRAAAKKVPASAKGARGIWLRSANLAEKAIGADLKQILADVSTKAACEDMEAAVASLRDAIALHQGHMDGSVATSEESQQELMDMMASAYEAMTDEPMPEMSGGDDMDDMDDMKTAAPQTPRLDMARRRMALLRV